MCCVVTARMLGESVGRKTGTSNRHMQTTNRSTSHTKMSVNESYKQRNIQGGRRGCSLNQGEQMSILNESLLKSRDIRIQTSQTSVTLWVYCLLLFLLSNGSLLSLSMDSECYILSVHNAVFMLLSVTCCQCPYRHCSSQHS